MGTHATRPRGHRLPNLIATLVLSGAVGLAYFNCDPMIAGSEPATRVASLEAGPMLAIPSIPARIQPAPGEPRLIDGVEIPVPEPMDPNVLRGKWALQMSVALLERGIASFENVDSYSFTFARQERVDGALLAPQLMTVKLRHEPFSVYMKWLDGEGIGLKGRQLIYVSGQNDDKLLVQPGGLAGRATGTLKLSFDDSRVKGESRHPVTECGLLHLAKTLLGHHRHDLDRATGYYCELHDGQTFNNRPCYLVVSEYTSRDANPTYRKSMMYIDKELSLPTCVRNFTWSEEAEADVAKLDEETLLEAYSYTDIQSDTRLAEEDFSKGNKNYRMR